MQLYLCLSIKRRYVPINYCFSAFNDIINQYFARQYVQPLFIYRYSSNHLISWASFLWMFSLLLIYKPSISQWKLATSRFFILGAPLVQATKSWIFTTTEKIWHRSIKIQIKGGFVFLNGNIGWMYSFLAFKVDEKFYNNFIQKIQICKTWMGFWNIKTTAEILKVPTLLMKPKIKISQNYHIEILSKNLKTVYWLSLNDLQKNPSKISSFD